MSEEVAKKEQLLQLFANMTGNTKIVEPMKKIHGTLRDSDAVEREIALIMRELLDQGFFKTKLKPIQLAKLVCAYYSGKNDTEIARELGDEKLSKTVARARVRMKLFRELDFKMPFDRNQMENLLVSGKTMKEISESLGSARQHFVSRHVLEAMVDREMDLYWNASAMSWKTVT